MTGRPGNAAGPVPSACRANSFTPETEVLMADGGTKPISAVEIGDWVMAADPETGEKGPRQVTNLISGQGLKELVDIEIDGDVITATDEHPFWVELRNTWVNAEDLQTGDTLVTPDGTTVTVADVNIYTVVAKTVHNLTVNDIQTYYVVAGQEQVLVHNCQKVNPWTTAAKGPVSRSEARRLLSAAQGAERQVTSHLQGITQSVGGELVGLDYRLKTLASLEEKLIQRGVSASEINDVLRYTITYSEHTFSASAKRAFVRLESLGYEKVFVRNTFLSNASYKGINTTFKTPTGQLFELQFHTAKSFHIKQNVNHALYDELRLLPLDNPRWGEINAQIKANSALIPIPPGAHRVR